MEKQSASRTLNRLATVRDGGVLVAKHYEGATRAAKQGECVGWLFAESPRELFKVAGIHSIASGNWGARAGALRANAVLLEAAESEGFPRFMCPYMKGLIGHAILIARDETDKIPPEIRLPKPSFMGGWNRCSQGQQCMEAVNYYLKPKVSTFVIDTPHVYDDKDLEKVVGYVVLQMEDLIAFIERLTGRPYPWAKLCEWTRTIRDIAIMREEIWQLAQAKPTPMTMGDWAVALGAVTGARDDLSSIQFFKKLKAEVEDRVKNGVGSVPDEEIRIMWHELLVWHSFGSLTKAAASLGCVMIPGSYILWDNRPELIDPERPLWSMVQSYIYVMTGRSMEYNLRERVKRRAIPYNVDGVIFSTSPSCKNFSKCAYVLKEQFESDTGIPGVVVSADHCDSRFHNEDELEQTLSTFIDIIKARKDKHLKEL